MMACDVNCNCVIFHQETLNKVKDNLLPDEVFIDMVNLFKVFSDLTRIKILESIKDDALCVCDLGHLLGVSKSAISHQMKYLKTFDLVQSTKEGKMVYYRLKNEKTKEMIKHALEVLKG